LNEATNFIVFNQNHEIKSGWY